MVVLAPAARSTVRAPVGHVRLGDSPMTVLMRSVLEGCAGGLMSPRLAHRVVDQDDSLAAVLALDSNVSVFTH